jgi:thiamine kinase-like enzyme
MSGSDHAHVRWALERILPRFHELESDLQCERLDGGLEQRSLLITAAGERHVLRLHTAASAPLLDVATEARVTQAAAAAGLAPRVIGADEERGALLTEYRAGATPWTASTARALANIKRAADLLRELHRVRVSVPAFAPAEVAANYVADVAPTRRYRELGDELVRLARDYETRYHADSLCHNDLVAANVLDDGGLTLVDFEYAVCGAPILDLASLAGMNDYTESQRRELLAAYYRESVPVTAVEFAGVVRMVRLLAFFWAMLGAQRGGGVGYSDLADRMARPLD